MRIRLTFLVLFILTWQMAVSQISILRGDSIVVVEDGLKKLNTNLNFTIIPGPVYGATDKLGFVILPMLVYNINRKDTLSPPSSSALMIYFDFHGSWQLAGKQSFYWNDNKWRAFITGGYGRIRMRFYGIGRDTSIINNDKSNYSWISTYQGFFSGSCYRKVVSDFYAGLEYNYTMSYMKSEDSTGAARLQQAKLPEDEKTYESVLVPSFVWDNRNYIYWSTSGYFASLSLQLANKLFFSKANYSIITGQVSGYHLPWRENKKLSLAWFFYTQLAWGDFPYTRYSMYGRGDNSTGYTHGKYVNNSEFTTQVELRYDLRKFLCVGGYFGTGKTFKSLNVMGQSVWLHYYGVRLYFNIIPSRNIRLRLDFSGARQDYGFFLGMFQAF